MSAPRASLPIVPSPATVETPPRNATRRHRVRATLVTLAAVLVVVLVAVPTLAVLAVRAPWPTTSGRLTLPGLSGEVTVQRDAQGVATITAQTGTDLFRAQGYVAAQDRFFEMDFHRHVASGTLSSLVGADDDALASDRVVRTLGWREVAEQEWELLSPATRRYLQAYADGVNAYLAGRSPGELAIEYRVLGLRVRVDDPQPWEPVDSLVWLKAMAWSLRSNDADELGRALAYGSVRDLSLVEQIFPDYPQSLNAPVLAGVQPAVTQSAAEVTVEQTVAAAGEQAALDSARRALAAVPQLMGSGDAVGSNSWVVSGRYTESGAPLLANDPHLGIAAPGVWWQTQLRCADVSADCPFDVAGFGLAGVPGVLVGHNADLAWGITSLEADVTDYVVERVRSADDEGPTQVLQDGVWSELDRREETIEVAGGPSQTLTVLTSSHGPIVSDVLDVAGAAAGPLTTGAGTSAVAVSWAGLTPGRTMDALLALDTATDADSVRSAAALLSTPALGLVFATTSGSIGYQAAGSVPVRAQVLGAEVPSDGTWPRPGWDSAYDWQGFVDAASMPGVVDPPEGYLVAANQAVTAAGAGEFLGVDTDYGFRAQRIRSRLAAQIAADEPLTVQDQADLQLDTRSPAADVLVPALLGLDLGSSFDSDGQKLLLGWNRRMDADSPAALYFAAVWGEVLRLAFGDDLPEAAAPYGDSRWVEVVRTLLDDPDNPWWDDRSTPRVVEGRDEILSQAMVDARRDLTAQIGRDASRWRWGLLHVAAPTHVLGGDESPSLLQRLLNPAPVAVDGGSSVVDATAWDASSGSYAVTSAPSMRMVVDLSDLDSSRWVAMTGVSGHPRSPHYADQLATWVSGSTYAWPFSAAAVSTATKQTLTLHP